LDGSVRSWIAPAGAVMGSTQACGDRAAVVLKGGLGGVQVIMLAEGLTSCWLHESQFAWLA
jgi:hypothetical protein